MTLATLLWTLARLLSLLGDRCARVSIDRREHAYGGRHWTGPR